MFDVLKELKTEFNAYAETLLAHNISSKTAELASVHKVSAAILELMVINHATLAAELETSPHVHTELLSPKIHGHLLLPQNVTANGSIVLALIINTLKHEKDNLAQLMQIHAFFIYRLYDHCENKDNAKKTEWVKQLFHNDLFAHRERQKIDSPKESLNPGVINNAMLAKKMEKLGVGKPGSSPKDQFKLSSSSSFFKSAEQHNLPIACDVSGHTGSLLLGALLYGNLSHAELQEYLTAAFSFLTLARAHTFHEVMIVGQTVGLPFSFANYNQHLPEQFRSLSTFTK